MTTAKNFVVLTSTALPGTGYTAGVPLALPQGQAASLVSQGLATPLDTFKTDLSTAGYAKNGAVVLALAVSTPHTIDLTALGAETAVVGDVAFATWNELIFANSGAHDVTIKGGASNPANLPLTGTTPGFTLYAGSVVRFKCPAGQTVDSTHKTITFDPGANVGAVSLCIGGA